MQNRKALNPETRVLYGDSLQPPSGYVFDGGIATTFSLDFETALTVPISLALFAVENRDELLSNPLALLEGAERIAGKLVIFVDAGHLHAQSQPHSRLCSLLGQIIVEVAAPGGGAFHPKIWALRFQPTRGEGPKCMRLLVLSRNLTRDRSWDISLRLDGKLTSAPVPKNQPIFDLFARLPNLAVKGVSNDVRVLTTELAKDIHCTVWKVPDSFDSVGFAVNGLGEKIWQPENCDRLGVISPFCDTKALRLLSKLPKKEKPVIISRSDQLAHVDKATLDAFDRVSVLDNMVTEEDGEEMSSNEQRGLHAKAFISEISWDTVLTIGSGNATSPALISGTNVEVFASLKGRRSKVGSVEDIMGENGFGRLTHLFDSNDFDPIQKDARAAEMRILDARRALCRGGLYLQCESVESKDGATPLWRVCLIPTERLPLKGIDSLCAWPITRGAGHSCDVLAALRLGTPVGLGVMSVADLTCFLAFKVTPENGHESALFSTSLIIKGLPAERDASILHSVIDSPDAFLRYLRILLSDIGNPFYAALVAQESSSNGNWTATPVDDMPFLEDMVRDLCRDGKQLDAVERLMTRLEPLNDNDEDPIPKDFRTLWDVFRAARKSKGA